MLQSVVHRYQQEQDFLRLLAQQYYQNDQNYRRKSMDSNQSQNLGSRALNQKYRTLFLKPTQSFRTASFHNRHNNSRKQSDDLTEWLMQRYHRQSQQLTEFPELYHQKILRKSLRSILRQQLVALQKNEVTASTSNNIQIDKELNRRSSYMTIKSRRRLYDKENLILQKELDFENASLLTHEFPGKV